MPLRNVHIREKLMTVIMLTSAVVLMVTCGAFATYEVLTMRKGTVEGYTTRAVIIAENAGAALAFQNQMDADQTLSILKMDKRIMSACIYDNNGKVFAEYPAQMPPGEFPAVVGVTGYEDSHLNIFYPVMEGNRRLGTVYLKTDLSNLTDHLHAYALLAACIMAASLLLAYFLSRMLQKQISRPVLALAETAEAISKQRDFSVRARKFSNDEVGQLTDAFNQMLEEIQTQDEAIKKLNAGLEQRIVERTAELESTTQEVKEANLKLRDLDKLKTDFFANVSHELRTPLTLILAPVEALLASENAAPPKETLQLIQNNALRLLQMVHGLLDFSKVSAKKIEAKREPINVVDLTRSILWDFTGLMKHKNIQTELVLASPHPVVEMDRYLYERIFFNLLSNAVKFTPANGKISVLLEVVDDRLTLSVTDTGIGISEEEQAHLFEKFHQVEGSATRRFEGTGLGLALCKEFALLLGGTVTVKSEPEKGSIFTMVCWAPQAQAETEPVDFSDRKPLVPIIEKNVSKVAEVEITDKPKVLIAEDNPEMSEFIRGLLLSTCNVRVVADGVEALAMARRWHPDLVLSDVMMPLMDGIRLTKEIKGDKDISSTPVVLLTAMTDRESLMTGWQAGADDYLFKPFHPRELQARVKSFLDSVQWRRKGEAYRRQRDALEHFTHIASHDLREPLRTIISFVQLFQLAQTNMDEESQSYLTAISQGAKRMYRLLDALMEYSRLDRERNLFEKTNLKKIVEVVEEDMNREIQGVQAQIEVGNLPQLTVMKGQMGLVFQNLIGNSIKYRKDKGPLQIRVNAVKNDIEWTFSVSDNGIGFDPAQSEKIFIMFERLHGSEKYQGNGMGLAICRKIIEMHGGKIWAESKPGEGSTFYFTLPVEREPQLV